MPKAGPGHTDSQTDIRMTIAMQYNRLKIDTEMFKHCVMQNAIHT